VRLGVAHRKEKKCLIRVRQNDLFRVFRAAGQSRQNRGSRFNCLDLPFPFSDISYPNPIADGYEVSPASLSANGATNGTQEGSGFIPQLNAEKLPEGANDDPGQRRLGGSGGSLPLQ